MAALISPSVFIAASENALPRAGGQAKHALGDRTGKIGSFLAIQNKMIPNVE
jgi:hypothetical protein